MHLKHNPIDLPANKICGTKAVKKPWSIARGNKNARERCTGITLEPETSLKKGGRISKLKSSSVYLRSFPHPKSFYFESNLYLGLK